MRFKINSLATNHADWLHTHGLPSYDAEYVYHREAYSALLRSIGQ